MRNASFCILIGLCVWGLSSCSEQADGGPGSTCPCAKDNYCDPATNHCASGCLADADCESGRLCDPMARQCVPECHSDSECASANGMILYCATNHICSSYTPPSGLCTGVYPMNAPQNAVVIGALVNTLTGGELLLLDAFKLAIDQVNPLRSPDPPLSLRICEVGASPDDALHSMEVLARQYHATAVVGPSDSAIVLSIKDEVLRSAIPIMSPSATSAAISNLGTTASPVNGLFFRVAVSDSREGAVLAHQLPTPYPAGGKLALMHIADAYGSGIKDTLVATSAKQADLTQTYSEPDIAGTQSAANTIIAAKPDYVVAISKLYPDIVVKALLNLSQTAPASKMIMNDAAMNQSLLDLINTSSATPPFVYTSTQMNNHLSRIAGVSPTADFTNKTGTGAYTSFVSSFQSRFSQNPGVYVPAAFGYDGIFAVALAIGAAGSTVSPAKVSEFLAHLNSYDMNPQKCTQSASNQVVVGPTSYLAGKSKLAMEAGLVLQGTTGTICFNPHGDRVDGLYQRWTIDTTNKAFTLSPTM